MESPDDAGRARSHEAETGAVRPSLNKLVEQAVAHVVARGEFAYRDTRRRFRDWFKAGLTFEQVKAKIDAGEHLPPSPL